MIIRLKGVYEKRKRLASGQIAVYCYDRATGARIQGAPGTVEFSANLERVRGASKADRTVERSFAHLAREYRRSVGYVELAPRTREEYDRHIDRYLTPVFGDTPIAHVRREHMTVLMSQYSDTPTLARAIKRTASVMWTFAIDGLQWIDAHPFMGMAKQRRRAEEGKTPLSESEIARFRMANPRGTHERLGFEIGLCSALRINDVVLLPTEALTAPADPVRTGKTGSVVLLGISAEARAAFAAYAAAKEQGGHPLGRWLFPGGSDGRLHRRTFSGDMAVAFERAEIEDKRFHALRYTACIRLFEAGLGFDKIAQHAGHAMAAMAAKYCGKKRGAVRNAKIMDAFDADGPGQPVASDLPSSPPRHGGCRRRVAVVPEQDLEGSRDPRGNGK